MQVNQNPIIEVTFLPSSSAEQAGALPPRVMQHMTKSSVQS